MNLPHCRNGLNDLTVDMIRRKRLMGEIVAQRLNQVPLDSFQEETLGAGVRTLAAIVDESFHGGCPNAPVSLLMDAMNGLDYFLKVNDDSPDTYGQGYVDDLKVVMEILAKHKEAIQAFKKGMGAGKR